MTRFETYDYDAIVMLGKMGVKPDLGLWLPLLDRYRLTALPFDTVLRGALRPDLTPVSPEVIAALEVWPASAYLDRHDDGTEVVLVYGTREASTPWPWLHAGLLIATAFTMLASGALMVGRDPLGTRLFEWGGVTLPYPSRLEWSTLWTGASFALPFLGVLLAHEFGHYFAARAHRVRVSLPYFIPFPPYLSIIGTIGAFIRLRGPTVRRSVLFDVGAAGPLASFVLSVPLLALGLSLSRTVPGRAAEAAPFLIRFAGQPVRLGGGVATSALAAIFGPESLGSGPILLHPLALVGWLGLFVTALNLLPLGQLDGGHILYSLSPRRQGAIARGFLLLLLPLGFAWWGWWGWAVVIALVHRGRVSHPSVIQPGPEIGRPRTVVGWVLIAIFLLTFVPVPLDL